MSAKHALLGLLLDRPGYPYQLADRLQELLGPSWRINSGQLSQTIRTLVREGLIERLGDDEQAEDQRRQMHVITSRGTEAYEVWFASLGSTDPLFRRPLLVKLALAGPEQLQDIVNQMDEYQEHWLQILGELTRTRDKTTRSSDSVRADRVIFRLSLSADIRHAEAELEWAREARATVAMLLAEKTVWFGRRNAADERLRLHDRDKLFNEMASHDHPLSAIRG